jgi:alkylation response protein AidB-like acyl-CoA dehydrogenase
MNLALTDDQRMIREAAAGFLADASSSASVRAAIEKGGFDEALWRGIADMGWLGTAVPEVHGGLGLTPVELVLILEQAGRRLVPAPFLATVTAATLIAEVGNAEARAKYLPDLARGALRAAVELGTEVTARKARKGWTASGRLEAVPDAASAQLFLVGGKGAIFALAADARGVRLKRRETWDGTRPVADVTLRNAPAERIDDPARRPGRARARALARSYLAAEQLGGAQECLDLTLRYISERRQFGRAIASFQAVKHRCAQMMVQVEGLRSAVYGAAAGAATGRRTDAVAMDCAMARALAADTFFHCAAEAIQLHGGVGFTWEFDPHLYFKRAQAGSHRLGGSDAMREEIAQALL